jgi:hypothetical protein
MFKRFFNALAGLTAAVDVPALEHQTEQETPKNGRKRAAVR